MGLGQKLQFATRRNKTNQIRIRKRELDASNNRSFASEIVSSDYEVTALVNTQEILGENSLDLHGVFISWNKFTYKQNSNSNICTKETLGRVEGKYRWRKWRSCRFVETKPNLSWGEDFVAKQSEITKTFLLCRKQLAFAVLVSSFRHKIDCIRILS